VGTGADWSKLSEMLHGRLLRPGVVTAQQAWLASIYDSVAPYVLPQSYQNWPDRTLADWQRAYFGSNLERLTEVKAKYDPKDRFSYAQSVPLKA
jgi:FAD/FMN-containing dehydrogenase